jgi:hypothetical protein
MTSAVGGSPLPESLSGPCRRLRYHEHNTHKVTKTTLLEDDMDMDMQEQRDTLLSAATGATPMEADHTATGTLQQEAFTMHATVPEPQQLQ